MRLIHGSGRHLNPIPIGMSRPMADGPALTLRTCQWIDGEPSADDSCKCGDPVVDGKSYCKPHFARAYSGFPNKNREKARWHF